MNSIFNNNNVSPLATCTMLQGKRAIFLFIKMVLFNISELSKIIDNRERDWKRTYISIVTSRNITARPFASQYRTL